jgi:AcrR family transcriptional regulator
MEKNDIVTPRKIKDRLYPVVLDLFSREDFHQVNLRDIAANSGISTGTIYKYFPSKEALLFSILDENIAAIGTLIREHIAGIESGRELFRKIFWVTMDFYDRNPGVAITAFITVPMRSWMKERSYRRDRETDPIRSVLVRARERGDFDISIDDRHISDLYYMFCHRHIHSWYYHGMKWRLADTISDFYDLFWKIMAPPPPVGGPR